jgi:8-oxo-dGTP pyrophosphatase MutT (NUDIX family)
MPAKYCDNHSVGVIITDHDERLLLITRSTPAFGRAPVAGHQDQHGSADAAARAEVRDETGLTVSPASSSRSTRCLPMPSHPSTAHTRYGHLAASASIAANPAWSVPYRPLPSTVSSSAIASIVADRLCRSIPITTRLHLLMPSPVVRNELVGAGGHRFYQQNIPFFSLSRPAAAGQRMPNESHTTHGDSRERATTPTTSTEPWPKLDLPSMKLEGREWRGYDGASAHHPHGPPDAPRGDHGRAVAYPDVITLASQMKRGNRQHRPTTPSTTLKAPPVPSRTARDDASLVLCRPAARRSRPRTLTGERG